MPASCVVPPPASRRPEAQRCLEVQGAGGDAEIRRLCSDSPQEGDKEPRLAAQARTMAAFLSCTKRVFKVRHEVEHGVFSFSFTFGRHVASSELYARAPPKCHGFMRALRAPRHGHTPNL